MKAIGIAILASLAAMMISILFLFTIYIVYLCIVMIKLCNIELKTKVKADEPKKVIDWLKGETLFEGENDGKDNN